MKSTAPEAREPDAPPSSVDTAWLEADHTIQARVSDELLELTRERRLKAKLAAQEPSFADRTVERRIPEELMELARSRRQARAEERAVATSSRPASDEAPSISEPPSQSQLRLSPGALTTPPARQVLGRVSPASAIASSEAFPRLATLLAWALLVGYVAWTSHIR